MCTLTLVYTSIRQRMLHWHPAAHCACVWMGGAGEGGGVHNINSFSRCIAPLAEWERLGTQTGLPVVAGFSAHGLCLEKYTKSFKELWIVTVLANLLLTAGDLYVYGGGGVFSYSKRRYQIKTIYRRPTLNSASHMILLMFRVSSGVEQRHHEPISRELRTQWELGGGG